MKALVTGNLGFIGSHFERYLKAYDWTVFGFDIRGKLGIDAIEFFRHDHTGFDLVVHCAASIPDLADREQNAMPVALNIAMDSMMFQWAMRTKPAQTIYFSSAAAYPIDLNTFGHALHEDDIDLDDIRQPDGMYGFSKLAGEVQAREAKRQGLNVLIVRPQTGYGLGQTTHYPIPAMVERAHRRDDPLVIWGSGEQVRDPIYVDDITHCVMEMVEAGHQGPVNIGNGEPWTVAQIARLVCDVSGYQPEFQFLLDKPEGSPVRYAHTEQMRKFYHPLVDLEEGVWRMVDAANR